MKSSILKGLVAGLLCWNLAAPAQTIEDEARQPLKPDPTFEDGLRRAGIVTGQVLLTSACLAGIAAAVAGRTEVGDPVVLCGLLSKLEERLKDLKESPRSKPKPEDQPDCPSGKCPRRHPKPVVLKRPLPVPEPAPAPFYHSASTKGPLFR